MQFRLSLLSGRSSFFNGVEDAKVIFDAIGRYVSAPLLTRLAPADAFCSRFVRGKMRDIFHVLRPCSLTKIFPSVVAGVLISMVNFIFRPAPSNNRPSNSMGLVKFPADANQNSSVGSFAPGDFPYYRFATYAFRPAKFSCGRVVGEYIAKFIWRDHACKLPIIPVVSIGGCHSKH